MTTAVAPRRGRLSASLLSDEFFPQRMPVSSSPRLAPTMDEKFPLVVPFGQDRFVFEPAPEDWILPLMEEVCELGSLPPNWNSYGARPIRPEIAATTMVLLLNVLLPDDPVPSVVPTSRGGILLEWHEAGIDLEIDIRSPSCFHVSLEIDHRCDEFEPASPELIAEKLSLLRSRIK